MGKMFLMCGLSGAGKTTFAKKFAEDNGYVYLGIDDAYKWHEDPLWINEHHLSTHIATTQQENPYDDKEISFFVWMDFYEHIHVLETLGKDVVIDTNAPTYVKRAQFIDWFPTFGEYNLIYIDAPRILRQRNNANRNRVVPDEEMERMEREFQSPVAYWGGKAYPSDSCWHNIDVYINEKNKLRRVPCCNN